MSPNSTFIDWCTDIAGQPQAFSTLEHDDKARAQRLAADRLQGLRDLATRHADDPAAALLAAAALDPPEDALYVVNGQPVIIGWGRSGGRTLVTAPPAPPPPVPAPSPSGAVPAAAVVAASAMPARRGYWLWGLLGLLLGLIMLAVLAWWLWPSLYSWWNKTQPDRLAVLEAEETTLNGDIAALEAELRRRLEACVAADAPPPEAPKTTEPETPKITQPPPVDTPAVIEDKPAPPPETPKPPEVKAAPPKAAPPKSDQPKQPATKPQTAKPQAPRQQANAPQHPPSCPPPRKKWEAPELVLLLDSSGSMRLKAGISQEQITALIRRARQGDRSALAQLQTMISGGGGDSRLSAAKAAVGRLLTTLPGDIDVGLVAFGHCQGADNYKFFAPSERGKLKALVDSIQPMEGTPLARGIERAGAIVDGRSVPATLVVVTDGEDSCGGDPCAAARALKAAKPKITINVVDVNGMGEGRCIAEATGGRVLPMKSAAELPELIRQASDQPAVPPGCGD